MISRDEFAAAGNQHFQRHDVNGDNEISSDEISRRGPRGMGQGPGGGQPQ
ncbi:MAG: hypothetical protein HC826_01125 [Rhodospirillales bacterium]|nr:hypothetical protein [Rhodospirillales bacterium]